MPVRQANFSGNFFLTGPDDTPSLSWQKLVRAEWVGVRRAARLVATLLIELAGEGIASPDKNVAWSTRTVQMAETAAEQIIALPLYGEYSAAKLIRISMAWFFKKQSIRLTMRPGALSVNWQSMSPGQPKKAADAALGGLDMLSPEAFVASIRDGGRTLPQPAQDAFMQLVDAIQDPDVGCILCDFMVFFERICRGSAFGSASALLAFLKHIHSSPTPLEAYFRAVGVNAGVLSYYLSANTAFVNGLAQAVPSTVITSLEKLKGFGPQFNKLRASLAEDNCELSVSRVWLDPRIVASFLLHMYSPKQRVEIVDADTERQ